MSQLQTRMEGKAMSEIIKEIISTIELINDKLDEITLEPLETDQDGEILHLLEIKAELLKAWAIHTAPINTPRSFDIGLHGMVR